MKVSNSEGLESGGVRDRFLNEEMTAYYSNSSSTTGDGKYMFSLALPSHGDMKGEKIPLPPHFTLNLTSKSISSCKIFYWVDIDVTRSGIYTHKK